MSAADAHLPAVTDPRGADDPAAEPRRAPEFVQSLERGLAVVRAFDAEHPQLTLSDVARTTGLTRAAARRFLLTLVELGYVQTDGRLFWLRPRVLELGFAYLSSLTLPEVAQPHLERLSDVVHESASLSVLDGDEVVYVARVATRRIMNVALSVGTRLPAYVTSMGRIQLAYRSAEWLDGYLASARLTPLTPRTITDPRALREQVEQAAAQGWALVDQELEDGLRSIAAPVRGADGTVVAAVNVAAPARRGTAEDFVREVLPPLLRTAEDITADLRSAAAPARRR